MRRIIGPWCNAREGNEGPSGVVQLLKFSNSLDSHILYHPQLYILMNHSQVDTWCVVAMVVVMVVRCDVGLPSLSCFTAVTDERGRSGDKLLRWRLHLRRHTLYGPIICILMMIDARLGRIRSRTSSASLGTKQTIRCKSLQHFTADLIGAPRRRRRRGLAADFSAMIASPSSFRDSLLYPDGEGAGRGCGEGRRRWWPSVD